MQKLIVVMGANATGKTHFIEHQFTGNSFVVLNVYDYQMKAFEPYGDRVPFDKHISCLLEANQKLTDDTILNLKNGKNVVVEQTFYKAKRRIGFVDEIRKSVSDVEIELYFMNPTEPEWTEYISKRGMSVEATMRDKDNIEIPNIAEGFDVIYEVRNEKIQKLVGTAQPEIAETARQELLDEKRRLEKEKNQREERQKFLESFNTRAFWHICENCGKKEWVTAEEAFQNGWDYPPHMGKFGLLGPRTCGNCTIDKTLYWKSQREKERFPLTLVIEQNLTEDELVVWKRIKGEPQSLLEEELR